MQELITAKIKEITENGKLDEIVTKHATEFVSDTVNDILRSYGDVAKAYKDKITKSLMGSIETMDFVQYSKSLSDLIESELNQSIVKVGLIPAKEMIKEFVGELEKKEWKLSEIVEKFIEMEVMADDDNESGEISFVHEKSDYGTHYVGFDSESDKTMRYKCKYTLMFNKSDGTMYAPTMDKKEVHPITEGYLRGFELFIFKLYACKCKIVMDPEKVQTEWYRSEY